MDLHPLKDTGRYQHTVKPELTTTIFRSHFELYYLNEQRKTTTCQQRPDFLRGVHKFDCTPLEKVINVLNRNWVIIDVRKIGKIFNYVTIKV
jgi:hypothetical protein